MGILLTYWFKFIEFMNVTFGWLIENCGQNCLVCIVDDLFEQVTWSLQCMKNTNQIITNSKDRQPKVPTILFPKRLYVLETDSSQKTQTVIWSICLASLSMLHK